MAIALAGFNGCATIDFDDLVGAQGNSGSGSGSDENLDEESDEDVEGEGEGEVEDEEEPEEEPAPSIYYSVVYETNIGSYVAPDQVAEGVAAARPANPTCDVANFVGWYTGYDYEEAWDFATPIEGDVTLYAKWDLTLFVISTADEFVSYGVDVVDLNDDSAAILLTDIDLGGSDWTPIGTADKPFSGYFYGNGFTINNLTISNAASDAASGLFGYVSDAMIRDVRLADVNITSGLYASALCAYVMGSVAIEKCLVGGGSVIEAFGASSTAYAAGFVAYGASGFILIDDSHNVGDISASNGTTSYAYAAGFVGRAATGLSGGVVITNSTNRGAISAEGYQGAYAAGILGRNNAIARIENATSSSAIGAYATTGTAYSGGIVSLASVNLTLSDVYNSGVVVGASLGDTSSYVGGIIGYLGASSTTVATNALNSGIVSSNANSTGTSSSSKSSSGGFAGAVTGSLTLSTFCNTGFVGPSEKSLATSYSGGVIGHVIGHTNTVVNAFDFYNCGSVGTQISVLDVNDSYAGGAIGLNESANVSLGNSYNCGTIGSDSDHSLFGAVAGVSSADMALTGVYYLAGTSYDCDYGGVSISASQMKASAFVATLNSLSSGSWRTDNAYINNGYPLLTALTY